MKSDKIPKRNYEKDYLNYEFASTVTNDKPHTLHILPSNHILW